MLVLIGKNLASFAFGFFEKFKREKILIPWLVRCRGVFDIRYLTGGGHYGPIFIFLLFESDLKTKKYHKQNTKYVSVMYIWTFRCLSVDI